MRSKIIKLLTATGVGVLLPALCVGDGPVKTAPARTVTPLTATYCCSPAAAEALNRGSARPLGLASADFNEDGFPDIVAAYDLGYGGALAVHYGVAAAHEASPFHRDARAIGTMEKPDFVAAGDFNGDDHFDIVTGALGSDWLYFFAGDGKGGFANERAISLPGRITAMVSGEVNRADGLADLVVAVSSAEGARLLVFESPRGALNGEPEVTPLPAEATGVELRVAEGGGFHDIWVHAADSSYRVRGRDRKLSLPEHLRSGVAGAQVEKMQAARTVNGTLPTGVIASLPVHFSGSRAGSRIELHAGKSAPVVAHLGFGGGFVVNDEGESGDGNLLDGVCDTGIPDHPTGICTLRAAIQQANFNGSSTSITFTTNVNTITVGLFLPEIYVPVLIDGLSGRTARVQLDGRNSFNGDQIYDPSGLALYGGNSTLTGMTIYGFVTGVKVASDNSGGNLFENNWIGPDNTGTVPGGRQLTYGILLEGGYIATGDNIVGGTAAGQGNLISTGNSNGYGIVIQSPDNVVEGNLVGTDSTGTTLIGNGHGIAVSDSSGNRIGGTAAGARNVIAGNAGSPAYGSVQITQANAPAQNNLVLGNYIGTDITGSTALGGINGGIFSYAINTTVGGSTAAARNVISGNGAYGVTMALTGGVVQGNYIGTDATGTSAVKNGCCGVQVQYPGTIVGGTGGAGNLISGNDGAGITINQSYVTNAQILGNIIGLNVTGTAALPNTGDGLAVTDISGSGHTFGAPGVGNVISGNGGNGISVAAGALTIQSNLIGLNAAGTAVIGNQLDGVKVNASNGTVVGGSSAGQGNVVSGNGGNGITMSADYNFTVQGNLVGTDPTGSTAMGNHGNGVLLEGGFIPGNCGNCPSSTGTVTKNTIANNSGNGIENDYGYFLTFRGNSIFANTASGILLTNGSNNGIAAPVLTAASVSGGNLQVQGSISNSPYGFPATLEFFNNNSGDNPVEGRTSLGTAQVNSIGAFSVSVPAATATLVTATVTGGAGDTSAFSNGLALQACAANVSAQTTVVKGPQRYNAAQHLFLQADTVTNTGKVAIQAPIYLAIDNLSSNATLANGSGTTSCNLPASPYITVLASGSLAAGASLPVQLQFSDPSLAAFSYTTRVLAGTGSKP